MISRRHRPGAHSRDSAPYNRTLVFFDAIYAFALTLLITTIDPPPADSWRSLDTLLSGGVGTQLLGFAISFIIIASYWRLNVRLVDRITELTPRVILLNIITVGLVIFIPLTTEAFSESDAVDYVLPVVIYAINISLLSLSAMAMRQIAINEGVYRDPPSPTERRIRLIDELSTPVVILLSIPVAVLFGGVAAHYWWLMLLITGPVFGKMADRAVARLPEYAGNRDNNPENQSRD